MSSVGIVPSVTEHCATFEHTPDEQICPAVQVECAQIHATSFVPSSFEHIGLSEQV